jgi:hypothetical protein
MNNLQNSLLACVVTYLQPMAWTMVLAISIIQTIATALSLISYSFEPEACKTYPLVDAYKQWLATTLPVLS